MMFIFLRVRSSIAQTATLLRWQWGERFQLAQRTWTIQDVPNTKSPQATNEKAAVPSGGHRKFKEAPLARLTSAVVVAAVVVPTVALAALEIAQAAVGHHFPASDWQHRLVYTLRPAVYDESGLLLGFIPPPGEVDLESFAVAPGPIPEHCVDLVLKREDAHHGNWLRYRNGVDIASIFRAAIKQRGGGSTIPMQVARQLAPEWNKRYGRLGRKALELGAANAVLGAHGHDARAVAKTYLAIAPFAIAFGDVRGIAAAADIMWGIQAQALSPAQCALLVAMLPVRPSLVDHGDKALAQWEQRRHQALQLVDRLGIGSEEQRVALQKTSLPPQRPALPGYPEAVTLNLGARTRHLVVPYRNAIAADSTPAAAPSAQRLPQETAL